MIVNIGPSASLLRIGVGLMQAANEDSLLANARRNVFFFVPPQHALENAKSANMEIHAMVAPNSHWLPKNMVEWIREVGPAMNLFVPSKWAQSILAEYRLSSTVFPHGCSVPIAAPLAAPSPRNEFRVLHVTSSAFGRKGTVELIAAWNLLFERKKLPETAVLEIKCMTHDVYLRLQELIEHTENVYPIPPLATSDVVELYNGYSLVCQPSRGEAFGLVPLEALASGVPAVATTCTGHSEYLDENTEGIVAVPSGPEAPLSEGYGIESTGPSVAPEDIADALLVAYERTCSGTWRIDAERWRAEWNWARLARRWVVGDQVVC